MVIYSKDKRNYIKFARSHGKNDIQNQKIIDTTNWENKECDFQPVKQNLSMKLLPIVLHAETIKKKAIILLNYPTALVLSHTTQVTAEEDNYLAVGRSSKETYKITIKMQLQEFQIFLYFQLLCCCFRKRRNFR